MNDKNIINNTRGATARSTLKALGSPKEIQRQNLLIVLTWLYRWGYSTADILRTLLGRSNRSHAKRMEAEGWIQSVSVKGYPTYYVLTEKGLNEAIKQTDQLFEYKEVDPYRVSLPKLHHYLAAQRETVHVLRNGLFSDYKTERMYNIDSGSALRKIPDVLFIEKVESFYNNALENQYTAVEIELTPKWNHHLDLFVTNILTDIQENRIFRCAIISDSPAILSRYQAAFAPGRVVKLWEKAPSGKVTDTKETLTIAQWICWRIFFRKTGSTEPYPEILE